MIDYDKVMRIGKQVLEDMYHRGYFDGQKDMPHDVVEAYNDGYADGQKSGKDIQNWNEVVTKAEEYQRGLDDAWECARKLCQSEKYGGLEEHCAEIFNRQDTFDVFDYSASEAIAKVKKYEDKQTKDDKQEKDEKSYIKIMTHNFMGKQYVLYEDVLDLIMQIKEQDE